MWLGGTRLPKELVVGEARWTRVHEWLRDGRGDFTEMTQKVGPHCKESAREFCRNKDEEKKSTEHVLCSRHCSKLYHILSLLVLRTTLSDSNLCYFCSTNDEKVV